MVSSYSVRGMASIASVPFAPPRLPFLVSADEFVSASNSSMMLGHRLYGKLRYRQWFVYQRAPNRLVVRDATARLQWRIPRR